MRVLMVTPGYYPIRGGTETMVASLSMELNKIGAHTDVMAFNMNKKWESMWRGKIQRIDGITVYKIPALNWLPVSHSARVTFGVDLIPGRFTYLFKHYDIIHFHEAEFSFPLFSIFVPKPKILHLHGIDYNYFAKYYLSKFVMGHVADTFLVITQQMKEQLIRLGFPENRIIHFPNCVDTTIFRPMEKSPVEPHAILYVGRITPDKGVHVLLKALSYLREPVKVEIIGPPDWNLGYFQAVQRQIETINEKGKHFISYLGRVEQFRLIESYQKASVFVLPSIFEPFGVVLLEALACGTAVVATRTGGIPEVVRDGENGLLVPPNNPEELGRSIQRLLDFSNMRKSFGQAGRKFVNEGFSLAAAARRLAEIYASIVD